MKTHCLSVTGAFRTAFTAAALLAGPLLLFDGGTALAQSTPAIYAPGEPIVTGFSGTVPPDPTTVTGDPLDKTFIDPDGNSMVIQQLQPAGPPAGQLIPSPPVFSAKAKDVGQVFGIALDDADVPNIYLTATSAFGLDIVVPGSDGQPVRSKVGAAGATFMPGQWGAAGGSTGSPGSIWKVDGTTGAISLFSTIAANSGAGLGDIAFDPSTEQFFVSDLDTGLIYRLGLDGTIIDTFDHGVAARPTHGLAPVADDNSEVDVTNPAFNSEDPKTWGFTQPERKVNGLAVYGGRLYYAVAAGPSIWSVGINPDGSFGDPRWELDVTGLPSTNEITNIVFDPEGRMTVAQRGPQVGSYDYSVFAAPKTSSVVRYTHEYPDDPTTPSTWVETPETYAIGFPPTGNNSTGGIALGYGFDPQSGTIGGACSAYLWSTGDSLRDNPDLADQLGAPAQVAGLQGNDRSLVRPQNDPPFSSYFTDYDGNTGDDQAALQGHVGDVEIWQNCQGGASGGYGGPYVPPHGHTPPGGNLTLTKWAHSGYCKEETGDYLCGYTIRVENTGKTAYWGPVTVDDWLPAHPPGADMKFFFQPPWDCSKTGSSEYECATGPELLYPGDSVDLHEVVKVSKPTGKDPICYVDNAARLTWGWGNDENPADDFDAATALIQDPRCFPLPPPDRQHTNLRLQKFSDPVCQDGGTEWLCNYAIVVTNTGLGNFSGGIKVTDTLGTNVTAGTPSSLWTCVQSGVTLTCNLNTPVANKPVGWFTGFRIVAHVKKATDGKPLCKLDNSADIAFPVAGSLMNWNGSDDHGSASATVPDRRCNTGGTDIQITKKLVSCGAAESLAGVNQPTGYACRWQVSIVNVGPGTYTGPFSFEDVSPNATANSLTTLGACTGSPTDVTCTAAGNYTLNPGMPITVPVITTYPPTRDLCSVTNTATILQPVPGSPSNPVGPDSASATGSLPNVGCGSTTAGTPNLTLKKSFDSCGPAEVAILGTSENAVANTGQSSGKQALAPLTAPLASTPMVCKWTVTITNNGTSSYTGPVTFYEKPDDPGATIQSNPAWCGTAGTNGVVTCSTSSTTIAAGASETVTIGEHVDVPAGQCTVSNQAWFPASGETLTLLPVPVVGQVPNCITRAPAELIAPLCPITQRAPKSDAYPTGCCPDGQKWNGSRCVVPGQKNPPPRTCPTDSTGTYPDCTCDKGTRGTPGDCTPIVITPTPGPLCPKDSHWNVRSKSCVCDDGTTGTPGSCKTPGTGVTLTPILPVCPKDSHWNARSKSCVCDTGLQGKPGSCKAPGNGVTLTPLPKAPSCPADSHWNLRTRSCVCNSPLVGTPGRCIASKQPILEFKPKTLEVNPRVLQFNNIQRGQQLR